MKKIAYFIRSCKEFFKKIEELMKTDLYTEEVVDDTDDVDDEITFKYGGKEYDDSESYLDKKLAELYRKERDDDGTLERIYKAACMDKYKNRYEKYFADSKTDLDNEEMDFEEEGTSIEVLGLYPSTERILKNAGIYTVQKIQKMKDSEFAKIRAIGRRKLNEIRTCVANYEKKMNVTVLSEKNYIEKLESLVGLSEVKEIVKKLIAFVKMRQEMEEAGRVTEPLVLNMEFVGNPGTAKTSVARMIAGILSELGLLSSKEMIEVGRANLISRYVGQTAEQVKDIFERAKGKLLFIDEAYSLLDQNENSYGDEALSTIVQQMENHRKDTVVIFAGYPDKMEELFERNPGMRSRVPFKIHFKDYKPDEMVKITEMEADKKGFSISERAKERMKSICLMAEGKVELGNGRFCRNMVEQAILSYALRNYGEEGSEEREKSYELQEEDFDFEELPVGKGGERVIGFKR